MEEQQRQLEEQQRQQEEQQQQEQQQQEQQQQEEQEPEREYISEGDAADSARAAVDSMIGDSEVLNTTVDLEIGGDAPHYSVYFSTEDAGYVITLDAYTGEVWDVEVVS